jgi:uncharacterized protein HemX
MIHLKPHLNVKFSPISVIAVLLLLAVPIRAIAADTVSPMSTNAAQAEQQRILQSYDAELSHQRKLEVGKERYERRQADRAKAIEALAAELAARQKVVVIQPAAAPYVNKGYADTSSWLWLLLGVAALGAGFLGWRYYRSRQNTRPAR